MAQSNIGLELRQAMRSIPTGVALLTVTGPTAMVVNSMVSVSLDPAMMLVSIHERARILPLIMQNAYFGLNFLSESQRDLPKLFASSDRPFGADAERVLGTNYSAYGVPVISRALSTVECVLDTTYPVGDHQIVFGKVVAVHHQQSDDRPLIFYQSDYRGINSIHHNIAWGR